MIIDREYFDTKVWDFTSKKGTPYYLFEQVDKNIGAYHHDLGVVLFELDTLERIGNINMSDNRTNFKNYYTATLTYGWDGKRKTKKEQVKTLCTRGDYTTAYELLMNEYKNLK